MNYTKGKIRGMESWVVNKEPQQIGYWQERLSPKRAELCKREENKVCNGYSH